MSRSRMGGHALTFCGGEFLSKVIPSWQIVSKSLRLEYLEFTQKSASDDDRSFVATFSHGAKLFGYFDWGSVASLTMYDFDEIAAGFARNSLQFPPEAKYVATDVYIPFESIQDALRVLGVPILHDIV